MWNYKSPGIPDEMFIKREGVPGPTKEEIRVITISKARLKEGSYVIDVGCGVGGLTVEAALQVGSSGRVFAVDENEEAVRLTQENVSRFGVQNIVQVIHGRAPEVIANLPMVDAVIIGGSKSLKKVLETVYGKLKNGGRLVVNAIMLNTCCEALKEIERLGFGEVDVTTAFIAKGRQVPSGVMMMARNPITIIAATKI
ncbi:precorrin-6Y C5,15-methyltransferase (decarboxylating) subunit CbiT [Candidatus Bathyarchaeota archaeon]|nr:precorrin-6Y C5,15-methyltransferase (decarboxylating) subunit CbiT [Candidatus Bathyarchaeota archaeon]